jgi:ribokinase
MDNNMVVIGSTNVDFLVKNKKLPAFGETITGGTFMQNFGGKGANQAVSAARAGGDVTFVTCLGNDLYADELERSFRNDHINTSHIFREPDTATGTALILLDELGNNYISVASGANYKLSTAYIRQVMPLIGEAGMIVLQMEIPLETTAFILEQAGLLKRKVLFNLAPAQKIDPSLLKNVYAFVVNEVEASMVTGFAVESDEEVQEAARALLALGPEIVIITLGARGSYLASRECNEFISAYPVKAVDTTAAGDVYCGCLAVALTEGRSLPDSVKFASAASAISVTRMGAQPSAPFRDEIEEFMKRKN